jgi:outer membrane protein assembly factor BamB
MRFLSYALLLFLLTSLPILAEHTRRWRQSTHEEFLKGTAHGVAVRSDGRLELAPKFTLLADADASYLWSVRLDSQGTLFAAGGSPAKVFRFDSRGKPTVVFDSADLSAQAIAFDSKGTLYVGTSPDGKVYKVSAAGEKSLFFDPKTKYIWDLAFAPDGTLYVATGDKGQVFAVAPDGKGELFYASDEAHIRVIAFDPRGNLIAGTEPSGRILRIARALGKAAADGFVLYETSKREITSLAVASDGSIYVSAIGERPRATAQAPSAVITTPQGTTTITTGGVITSGQSLAQQPFVPFPTLLSSSIYRINPDGAPEELWSSREDVVYALGLASDGRLLAGTGNNGALLAIDGRGVFAHLAKAGSAQITGIARNLSGKVFLCTANPGKVFSVGPEYEAEGTYESRSFDTQLFSQWGRLEWWGPRPSAPAKSSANSHAAVHTGDPRLEFFVRSGNTEDPGKEWSRWFGPYAKSGAAMEAPSARFVQWKAIIHDGRAGDGIEWVSLAYLPRNVAPVIDGIAVQEPGVRAQSQSGVGVSQPTVVTLKQPPSPNTAGVIITQGAAPARFELPPQGTLQKGHQSVLWSAHDDNDDELRYAVYFRGESEHEWKLLKDNLEQKFYSWDTTTLPDGAYYLKIVATDAPSNPPAVARKTEQESERFEVDNTPPVIEGLQVGPASGKMSGGHPAYFTARDASTAIDRAQYSLDGGEWILLAPDEPVSDALVEHYNISLPSLPPGEHIISVRAYDRFENAGSAKITFTVPPAKP